MQVLKPNHGPCNRLRTHQLTDADQGVGCRYEKPQKVCNACWEWEQGKYLVQISPLRGAMREAILDGGS